MRYGLNFETPPRADGGGLVDMIDSDEDSDENAKNTPVISRGGILIKDRRDTPFKPRMGNVMFADDSDDESEEKDEEEDDTAKQIMEDAEEAYKALQQMEIDSDIQGVGHHASDVGNEPPFPDEGCASVEPKKRRFLPSPEDLLKASSTMGGGGICADMAKRAGCQKSSTDFGLRMGRSFRAAFSPDGSIFRPKPGGGFVKYNPVFTTESGADDSLLEKHRANSLKVGERSHPQFTLPSATTNGDKLQEALNSYSEKDFPDGSNDSGPSHISRDSFSLLKCISYGKGEEGGGGSGSKAGLDQLDSIKEWLVDSCGDEVTNEVDRAKARGSQLVALLAAVSGGDIEKACEISSEIGHIHLPILLAAGPDSRKDILKEVLALVDNKSKIPDDLARVYFLLGGDLRLEENLYQQNCSPFDWRRRLTMKLSYKASDTEHSLSSLVNSYERDLQKGVAPYPHPRYLKNKKSRDEIQCVLYRLLRLGKHEVALPLRDIIDPLGYTRSVHDFSLSFHLAAAVTAMYGTKSLSTIEEQTLIDGYVAQLLNDAKWEWAVYVTLCLFDESKHEELAVWKSSLAKSIVMRNYKGEVGENDNRREFLVSIGVPPTWFEEALAYRESTNGNTYGFLKHMINVSPLTTRSVLEETVIPSILFTSEEKISETLKLIQEFTDNKQSLCAAVSLFFQVHSNIGLLEGRSRDEIKVDLPGLLQDCKEIEEVFTNYLTSEATLRGPTLQMVPSGAATVPMACFLAEGLSQISLFKLQLRALQEGISLSNTASQILNMSLANDSQTVGGLASREDVCRWLM